jgi:hypothetical protein
MRSSIPASVLALAVVVLRVCAVSPCSAGEGTDGALAETLFREGKALMTRGSYAEACPKLAESQRLEASAGTALAVALCHERAGAVATAWAEYLTAASSAERAGQKERARAARERALALEPSLPRVVVKVADSTRALPGLVVRRDGVEIGSAAWDTPAPVDPGHHTFDAVAPGHVRWSTTVEVALRGSTPLDVPELAPILEPAAIAAPALRRSEQPDPPPASTSSPGRTVGLVVGGIGLAGLAVGGVFGVRALVVNSDAHALCPVGSPCMDAHAVELNDQAKASATVSVISLTAGAVLVGTGMVLLLVSRSSARTAPSLRGLVTNTGAISW